MEQGPKFPKASEGGAEKAYKESEGFDGFREKILEKARQGEPNRQGGVMTQKVNGELLREINAMSLKAAGSVREPEEKRALREKYRSLHRYVRNLYLGKEELS